MISNKIAENLKNSSWIRAMFEEGEKLRKLYGADKVYDFSLGNPDPEPPKAVEDALKRLISDEKPGKHGYMNNAGYVDVRSKISEHLNKENGTTLTYEQIVMSCGAGGALNVVLKTILNPGEEVIVFSPYFVEYGFYIDNHGGKAVILPADTSTFEPDINALKNSITTKTKAIIINSPNNPTGVVYSEQKLKQIAEILDAKEKEFNSTIFVISDEPYTKIVYDKISVPKILRIFNNSIIVDSFSKSLSLPGERIGYIAANNKISDISLLMSGLIFSNRTLGFVNAPALFQKVIAESLDEVVDVSIYEERRNLLYNHITKLGFTCVKPQGAFYLFPKSPIEDDVEFKNRALTHNIIIVPGRGFGCPGYFRLSYCISLKTIENSLPAFEALAKEFF